jgi:O-antigen/teichoic acid export membrane protein
MIRRFAVSLGGRIVAALLQLAVFALIARHLGAQDLGVYSVAASIGLSALWIADLGMGTRVLRGDSDDDSRRALATFLIVRVLITGVFPLGGALIVSGSSTETGLLVAASVLYVTGESSGDVAVGLLQGRRRSALAMTILLSRRVVALAPVALFAGADAVVIASAAAGMFGTLCLLVVSAPQLGRPMSLVTLVRQNLGIMASSGASTVAQLDVVAVTSVLGTQGAGLYSSALRLLNPLNLLVTTMMQVVIPELASATPTDRRRVFRRIRRLVLIFCLALVACSPASPLVIQFMYGDGFGGAAPVAICVTVAAAISAFAQVHLASFYATSVPRAVPISMFGAILIGIGAIWSLSVLFGLSGAGVGLVVMHILTMVAIVALWRRYAKKESLDE